MEWTGEGVLLNVRKHGETAAIIDVFTAEQGRHAGVVRGGAGRRLGPVLQPGAQLHVTWRARLPEHVGRFTVEPLRSRLGVLMADRLALAGLETVCALLSHALPERAADPPLYEATVTVLDLMAVTPAWPLAYLRWELALLETAGFALDLTRCAVTGATTGLRHVSPRTGRAVSEAGAGAHAAKLLPLPPCLIGREPAGNADIALALRTTGHFLEGQVGAQDGTRPFPAARARLLDLLARETR